MEASTRSLSTTTSCDGGCLAPKLCGRRERELGSNLIYISGCARVGSPRQYTGDRGAESEQVEAPE